MKKCVLLLMILSIAFMLNAQNFKSTFGLSLDFIGKQEFGNADLDVHPGISIFAEFLSTLNQQAAMGGGIELQLQRGFSKTTSNGYPKFAHIPIYLIGQINFMPTPKQTPYVIGHIGYGGFTGNNDYKGNGDLKGGLYYAAGAGYITNHINLRVMLKKYTGEIKRGYHRDEYSRDITTTHISVSFGVMF
ncbi:MAG: outer membrane beta-barrel protein [Candidatus Cloacimonetes bacterium]|nr:outer membrane beta-barrel protein [Candidatus Cloacimonadota bacterium]